MMYIRRLVDLPHLSSVDWAKWHVFWVDERVVPKDHPDSNYLLACDGFLSKVQFILNGSFTFVVTKLKYLFI